MTNEVKTIDANELVQSLKNKRLHILLENENDGAAVFDDVVDWIKYTPSITNSGAHIQWVRAEDKKPDAEKEVRLLCVTSTGYKYQCQGFYEPDGVCRDDSDYCWDWSCCERYDEEKDDYIVNPGWYETIHNWDEYSAVKIADTVTHWMPLPERPAEA